MREQWPVGDADGGEPDDSAELQREPGAARMVGAGGVDEQHVGRDRQRAHRCLETRTLAQRKQARDVGGRGLAGDRRMREHLAAPEHRGGGPRGIAARAGPGLTAREHDDARADGRGGGVG